MMDMKLAGLMSVGVGGPAGACAKTAVGMTMATAAKL
jgi:hypothetical protein